MKRNDSPKPNPPLPEKVSVLYHGTRGKVGQAIAESGWLEPGHTPREKYHGLDANLAPMDGRVYIATDPSLILEYALSMFGRPDGGWIFEVSGDGAGTDVLIDEDDLAEMVFDGRAPENLRNFAKQIAPDRLWFEAENGERPALARLGKMMIARGVLTSGRNRTRIMEKATRFAVARPMRVLRAWKLTRDFSAKDPSLAPFQWPGMIEVPVGSQPNPRLVPTGDRQVFDQAVEQLATKLRNWSKATVHQTGIPGYMFQDEVMLPRAGHPGRVRHVTIRVFGEPRWPSRRTFVRAGEYVDNAIRLEVFVERIRRHFGQDETDPLMEQRLRQELREILSHEMTHGGEYSLAGGTYEGTPDSFAQWANDPLEVRAEARTIWEELFPHLDWHRELYEIDRNVGESLVEYMLRQSKEYGKLDKVLSDENRRQIIRIIERELREAGVSTEGKGALLPNPTDDDEDEEIIDCNNVDYQMIQGPGDFNARFGYHWTTREKALRVLNEGFWAPIVKDGVWQPEEHETEFFYCVMPGGENASEVRRRVAKGDDLFWVMDEVGPRIFKDWNRIWYGLTETASENYGDTCLRIDLAKLGKWIAKNHVQAWETTDQVYGDGLAIKGRIPADMFELHVPGTAKRKRNPTRRPTHAPGPDEWLMSPANQQLVGLGKEKTTRIGSDVLLHKDQYGSHRFVLLGEDGEPVAALQVVRPESGKSFIANVYTRPEHRRKGYATKLLEVAKKKLGKIEHAKHLSEDGAAWAAARNPAHSSRTGLVTLYHGTSSEFEEDIRAHGLVAVDDGQKPVVYLAIDPQEAAAWAAMRVDNMAWRKVPHGHPIVVKVRVPKKNLKPGATDAHYKHVGDIAPDQILGVYTVSENPARKSSTGPVVLYHGTPKDFGKLTLKSGGVLWLTDNRAAAEQYVSGHAYAEQSGFLWTVTLKPGARIVDLSDLSIPVVRDIYEGVSDARRSTFGPIAPDQWPSFADFGLLEAKPWIVSRLKSARYDAVIVKDALQSTSIPHRSFALLRITAIQSATREPIIVDRGETIGSIEERIAGGARNNPARKRNPATRPTHAPGPDEWLMSPANQLVGLGKEKTTRIGSDVLLHKDQYGSHRFVLLGEDGEPVAALQVMRPESGRSFIANVYTRPEHRRKGYASRLLVVARKRLGKVEHAKHLSEEGAAWAAARNPTYSTFVPRPQDQDYVDSVKDELKDIGVRVQPGGTVRLYHFTSEQAAASIRATGKMRGKEDGLFFSTHPKGLATSFGETMIALDIPVRLLELDDIMGDEAHLRLPLDRAGQEVDVSRWLLPDAEREKMAPVKRPRGKKRP